MKIGMMWFDNDPKVGLETKIRRAVDYYEKKYGKTPAFVFVHQDVMPQPEKPGEPVTLAGVEVRTQPYVMPNHLWIGAEG